MMVIQRTWISVALVLSLFVCFQNEAHGQSLKDARAAYMEADFKISVNRFETLLRKPTLSKHEATEAHRYLATLKSILGSRRSSNRHVRAAVALDAKIEPAPGSPESLAKAFRIVREEFGRKPARIVIDSVPDGNSIMVSATLAPAPEALVNKISIRCSEGGKNKRETEPTPSVRVRVKATEGDVVCEAKALTENGAVLLSDRQRFTMGQSKSLPGLEGIGASPDRREDTTSKRKKWPWIVGIVGALAVGGTVTGIMLARRNKSDDIKLTGVTVTGW